MSFNDIEKKKIENELNRYIDKRRPPIEIRHKVDIGFKMEKNSIIIFEIRPNWKNPSEINEIPISKTTFNKTKNVWNIFWKRADLKWHKYVPNPEVNSVSEFITIVDKDDHGCFWG